MTTTPEQQYKIVVEGVRLVALDAARQIAILPEFVVPSDEIATTFSDGYLLVPQLRRRNLINEEAAAKLKVLDDWFEEMPTDGSIVSNESLQEHDFWKTARELARKALASLKEERCEPDLSHVFWVEGD